MEVCTLVEPLSKKDVIEGGDIPNIVHNNFKNQVEYVEVGRVNEVVQTLKSKISDYCEETNKQSGSWARRIIDEWFGGLSE